MKTKFFMTGLVMAAVLLCGSCGNSTERKLKEIRQGVEELEKQMKSRPVPDDEVLINPVLYQISDTRRIYDHRGSETDDLDFGRDHIDHRRILIPKESGGFEVGYFVKTTRGISLQANKAFYFYNKLGLTGDIVEIYSVAGMILSDGTLIPVRITVGRGAADGMVEYKLRRDAEKADMTISDAIAAAIKIVNEERSGR